MADPKKGGAEAKEAATLPYEAQSSVDVKNLEKGQRAFINDDQKAAMENAEGSDRYVFEELKADGGNLPIADGADHAWEVHLKSDDEEAEAFAEQTDIAGGGYPYGQETANPEADKKAADAEKAAAK